MSVAWMSSVLGLALAGDPSPQPDPEAEQARPRPFVQVGVGGGLVLARAYDRRDVMGGPTFAVEAGSVWNPRPRLRLGVGGALAQTGYAPGLTRANTDLLAKLRLGVGGSKAWGYGIVGAGLSLMLSDDYDYADFRVGPAALVGLGVRGRVGRRVSLGLDVESTIMALPPLRRITRASGLLVVEVRFGP